MLFTNYNFYKLRGIRGHYLVINKELSENGKEMENKIDEELELNDEFIDDFEDNN